MVFKVATGFVAKILSFKKGALSLLAILPATTFVYYLEIFTDGVDKKNLYMPVLIEISFIFIFILFSSLDLITGLQAAKYLNGKSANPKKTYIKSYKLYRTTWKFMGILLVTFMLMILSIITEIMKAEWMQSIGIWALTWFWVIACGFEFHSIGENLEKRSGSKPPIFGFWEKLLSAIQRKAISKIDDSFNIVEGENDEELENPKKEE